MSSGGYLPNLLNAAKALGYTPQGHTGTGHLLFKHPNGEQVTLPCTPSEYRGFRNAIALLERVAGRRLPRPNHRRSRKAPQRTGYNPLAAVKESAEWHAEHDAKVADLLARRDTLIAECQQAARDRGRLRDIPPRLDAIAGIEEQLRLMAQPVQPFDPYTLAPQ